MNNLYNKFRFTRKDLFHPGNEKALRFVFEQVAFFLEYHPDGLFSNRELAESVNMASVSAGLAIPEEVKLVQFVMDFFCDELGFSRSFINHYSEIREIITGLMKNHSLDGQKFIDPLTEVIIDEFNTADYSITMEEVVFRLKNNPKFRFLPYSFLDDTVDSVCEFFLNLDKTEP